MSIINGNGKKHHRQGLWGSFMKCSHFKNKSQKAFKLEYARLVNQTINIKTF